MLPAMRGQVVSNSSSRLLKKSHAARSSVKNRLKMLMYCVYTALFRQFLPCLALA
jgi:hypothetical protein